MTSDSFTFIGLDAVAFPDRHEIEAHAVAFANLMFRHSAFEREVRELQNAVTKQSCFGEQPENQWTAPMRPARMASLIRRYRGVLPQTAEIKKVLTDAIAPCQQRNLLAHGTWWLFDRRKGAIRVRGTTRWGSRTEPPKGRDYTVADINALSENFVDLAAQLCKLRSVIERPWIDDQVQGKA